MVCDILWYVFCGCFFRLINLGVVGLICVTSTDLYGVVVPGSKAWYPDTERNSMGQLPIGVGQGANATEVLETLSFHFGDLEIFQDAGTSCRVRYVVAGEDWFETLPCLQPQGWSFYVILNIPHSATATPWLRRRHSQMLLECEWTVNVICPWPFWNLTLATQVAHCPEWLHSPPVAMKPSRASRSSTSRFGTAEIEVEMHVIEISRVYRGLCQSHIVPSRYKSCAEMFRHWRRLSVWLSQSWRLQLFLFVAFLLCSEGEFVQRKTAAHGRTSSGVMLQPDVDGGMNLKKICLKDFEGIVV